MFATIHLSHTVQQALNKANNLLFTPCFLFIKVAFTLSPGILDSDLRYISLLITSLVFREDSDTLDYSGGFLCDLFSIYSRGLPVRQTMSTYQVPKVRRLQLYSSPADTRRSGFAMACSMCMNSNTIPIALLQNLVVTVPILASSSSDDAEAMLGRAVSYIMLFYSLALVVRCRSHRHIACTLIRLVRSDTLLVFICATSSM